MAKYTKLISNSFFRRLATFMVAGFVVGSTLSIISVVGFSGAQSVDELREESSQLENKIKETEHRADELHKHADSLQDAIQSYDHQIQEANEQINATSDKIDHLESELVQAEKDLEEQKGMLRSSMRALYLRGDASTIELLAASDSFSEFIDEQEYLERLKSSIQDSTNQVIALQEQMEAQKAEQKELLKQQEATRQGLADARQGRERMLNETRGEEKRFRQQREQLLKEQKKIDERIRQLLLAGTMASEGRVEVGQMIGRVGMTGYTFGPHLHFEMLDTNANATDPLWGAGTQLGYGLLWPVPSASAPADRHDYGCQSSVTYYTSCGANLWLHTGIDIPAPVGTPVVAAKAGEVRRFNGYNGGFGNMVIVTHDDGTYTRYTHLGN